MDWMVDEQERGITITSAVTTCEWKNCEIHIIDTPGHVDFTIEVERSLRVLDGAVGVFCAVGGVEPQSETVWRQADKYMVPKIAFINKMDRVGADFFRTVQMMRERLNATPLLLQIPMGREDGFRGILDLVAIKQVQWETDDPNGGVEVVEVSDEFKDDVMAYRDQLIEQVADVDDAIMELYLEEKPIPNDILVAAIRRATLGLKAVPVFCGAALKNKGIQPLLDAVVHYLPSPVDVPPMQGHHPETQEVLTITPKEKGPLVALIFKVSMMEGRKMSFVRIYSGTLVSGTDVYNPSLKKKEKISRIMRMHANKRERVESAAAGNIVGVGGLKDSSTGETLCDVDTTVMLEKMEFYRPVISISVEPRTRDDQEKMDQVLAKLMAEDPTLQVNQDKDTGQTILSGMGELHLEIIISRMKREYNTSVNVGKPQVVYRETLAKEAAATAVFDKEVAGQRHFGEVRLVVRPLPRGSGPVFRAEAPVDEVPEGFVKAVEQGVRETMEYGQLMGYPVVDVEVVLMGGSWKESVGSDLAFKVAASMASREAFQKGDPYLLEPIMDVEVYVPDAFMGEVIGDLSARGGKIESISAKADSQNIAAIVPLSKMFGYATALRSASQGRGNFTMKFSHFDKV